MVRKKIIYHRYRTPEHGKWCEKWSWGLFQLQISFKSWNSRNKCLWVDVSMIKTDDYSQLNSGHWHLLTAKFRSLKSPPSQILVTDVYSQPNSSHTDVSWAPCITSISAFKANLKPKKASAAFFTPFSILRGSRSMIYKFFSDHGWVPFRKLQFKTTWIW